MGGFNNKKMVSLKFRDVKPFAQSHTAGTLGFEPEPAFQMISCDILLSFLMWALSHSPSHTWGKSSIKCPQTQGQMLIQGLAPSQLSGENRLDQNHPVFPGGFERDL